MDKLPETNIKLPVGFLLGAASSAHQVEGNNLNSDWWLAEQQGRLPKSGAACDHYNRFEDDFKIARDIGLNAMRISIEWSRIEPVEGRWDRVAIEHYRKVLKSLKANGLTRAVTLHHFTIPQWLSDKGGFESYHGTEAFARFAWFVAQNLGDEIDYWITINEAEIYAMLGYKRAIWPPFKNSTFSLIGVYRKLIDAHRAAYKAIKQALPDAKVGIAKNNTYFEPYRAGNVWDKLACRAINWLNNEYFLNRVKKQLDFIGLNYYFYKSIKFSIFKYQIMNNEQPKSDMGWATYPEGIYHLLMRLKKYGKPVYVTENGIANARDDMRKDFIRQHLQWALKAHDEGVEFKGYFYWSLTDTYEWENGYSPKFGLVEVNFDTQERKVRPSAAVIKEIMP